MLTWALKDPINPSSGYAWQPADGPANATELQGEPISATAPATGKALVYDGTEWGPADVNAVKLQGEIVSSTAPTEGQFLKLVTGEDSVKRWTPSAAPSNATALQSTAVSATAPSNTQGLVFNGTNWTPADVLNVSAYSGSPSNTTANVGWIQIIIPGGSTPTFIPIYQ